MNKPEGTVRFAPRIFIKEDCKRVMARYEEHLNGHPVELMHLVYTRDELIRCIKAIRDCARNPHSSINLVEFTQEVLHLHGE